MILSRYGQNYQSVELNFDSKAMTEIGFRRDHALTIPVEEFREGYERLEEAEFAPRSEGRVQDETEQDLLDELEREIRARLDALEPDQVLLVENEKGVDYPKTKHETRVIVERGENRLVFTAWVAPALRIGTYRKRG